MALDVGRTLAHYRLVEQIGEGGMGVVWRAHDTSLERDVALKVLPAALADDPARLARFEREARIVGALNHPNVVTVHSVESVEGIHFFTMELIDGTSLDALLPATGFSLARFFDLAVPAVEAVAAAHARGVSHGDLKPRNLMVTRDGRIKVLDFGVARHCRAALPVAAAAEDPTITFEGGGAHVSGTLGYMAPEQIQGHGHDPRSDVFSLGIVMYEMLTGGRPFVGTSAADLIASLLKDTPPPPSRRNREVPRHLDRVIASCLAKDPRARPAAAGELVEELAALRRDGGAASHDVDRSIAVLPFADLSEAKDQSYLCEGIADELIGAISRIDSLRVASSTSSFRFKDADLDSREIGDRLGVGHLLEGSVRKAGTRLRVSARVVSVRDGCQLWAGRFDRELEDVFAIQQEIADSIVRALEVTLDPRERRAIEQTATHGFEAYDRYLRGRQLFRQFRRKSIERAREMFAQAIRFDPASAGAWAGLADCHSYLYMFWDVTEEHLREADAASRRAIELDPELAEAYVARGVAVSLGRRFDEADRQFEAAIRLNPRMFEAHYFQGRGHYSRGDLERAVECFSRASEARPEDYQAPSLLASSLSGLGRTDEAREAYRRTAVLAQRHLEVYPGEARALYFRAIALCQLGERRDSALELAERALSMDPDEPQVLYNVACVYALLGSAERALDCLERTIEHGGWWKSWAKHDPDLVSIQSDPRFVALVEG